MHASTETEDRNITNHNNTWENCQCQQRSGHPDPTQEGVGSQRPPAGAK